MIILSPWAHLSVIKYVKIVKIQDIQILEFRRHEYAQSRIKPKMDQSITSCALKTGQYTFFSEVKNENFKSDFLST